MTPPCRLTVVFFALVLGAPAAPPRALATALERLRDQKSYSWEVINADPGPVVSQVETRRGTITDVRQNISPHIKGAIDRRGDTLLRREWSDGLTLETVIAADGAMVTRTPEGWMTDREILSALAEERLQARTATPRARWLRRADRPDVQRPDQELASLLKTNAPFEQAGDSYTVRAWLRPDGTLSADPDEGQPAAIITLTLNLAGGMLRDYEVKLEATARTNAHARVRIPISDQRIVIITYLPLSRIDIPDEAREKLKAAKHPAAARPP